MMNIFINTTVDAFLGSTIPYYAREHGNVFAARKCYATTVLLFQENKITQKQAICMFDKVLELSPNFSDTDQFRQEIWHRILRTRSMSPEYPNYLKSPAWLTKKAQVLERDGYKCVLCNKYSVHGLLVHHKTYDNIGKEPLEDLTTLCTPCHEKYHSQPSNPQTNEIPPPSPNPYNSGTPTEELIPFEDTAKDQPQATPPAIPSGTPAALEESNDEEQDVPFYPSTPTEAQQGNQEALDCLNDILNQAINEAEEGTDSVKPTVYN